MYVYTTEYINAHYIFHNFPGLIVGVDEILVPPELTEEEILRALGNVPRIVVGILERWSDTLRVMNHWFPWIDFSRDKNRFLRVIVTLCLLLTGIPYTVSCRILIYDYFGMLRT